MGLCCLLPANPPPNTRISCKLAACSLSLAKAQQGAQGGQPKGKLGQEFTTDEGYQYARQAGIEVLAVVKSALATLDSVKRVVKVQGFINATADFEEHHKVLNGCSDLFLEVFGDKGLHARSVLGAASLRANLPVIIDSIFEIDR